MLKILLAAVLYLYCSATLFSQGTVSGAVADSVHARPVGYAAVRLFHAADSSFVKGAYTDEQGMFSFHAEQGKYFLEISLLGYKTRKIPFAMTSGQPVCRLDIVYLCEDAVALNEAVVEAQQPDVLVKGDTIEYNAAAYLSDESNLLQDLVKNLPGVELDNNGNLSVNGKKVNKITVDGKDFFNNYIQIALKNLPANMVKKLQLFQEQSEQSKTSGIKNPDSPQVLNLELKDEYRRNMFGDLSLGYGNKGRYAGRAMLNIMHDDDQLSVMAGSNNTNGDLSENLSMNLGRGIETQKEIAANINRKLSDTFNLNGGLSYSDDANLTRDESRVETISIEYGNAVSYDSGQSENDRRNWKLMLNLDWKPDSLTTVYFRINSSYTKTQVGQRTETTSYYTQSEDNKTFGIYRRTDEGKRYNLGGSLNIGRKLNAKGRNISLGFSGSIDDGRNNGFNYSLTQYASGQPDKTHDQRLQSTVGNSAYSISATYVEPLTEKESLYASCTFGKRMNNYGNDKYRKADPSLPDYTVIDTLYVSRSTGSYLSQQLSVGFQSFREKNDFTVSITFSPFSSKNTTVRQLDSVEYLTQKSADFLSQISYKHKFSANEYFSINYSGNTAQPDARLLSADTTIISNTSKIYGNPNLKAGYISNLNMYYQKSNYETGRFFYIGSSFGHVFNKIVGYTKKDSLFNTENSFKNVSGGWNADLSVTYNRPLKKTN
ncbi:MAG: TonB-dependent receptor [Prevotella sp.]|jgi:hypothetical protein|nr:TonB-dependent receptor [Prevotella sp.]